MIDNLRLGASDQSEEARRALENVERLYGKGSAYCELFKQMQVMHSDLEKLLRDRSVLRVRIQSLEEENFELRRRLSASSGSRG